jgi:diguanylate cyclase (GGDEF)-like protein/PAS domain S-box-containing protein
MNPGAATDLGLLVKSLSEAREGIAIIDALHPDFPLRYVNKGFARLSGYVAEEVIGKTFQVLQGTDTEQPEAAVMLAAIAKGESCIVTLRNYRKDGSMFRSELSIAPLHDANGMLTHFIGILRDATVADQTVLQPETSAHAGSPGVLGNRSHFDERFSDILHVAQRTRSGISVLVADLDNFKLFNERYGRLAGDECLRRVGDCIAKSFIRTTDCMVRYGGEEFAVVSLSAGIEALRHHAQILCEHVRQLNIPHSDSPHGVVTISIGGVYRVPNRETSEQFLLEQAERELLSAKGGGRDRVHIIG